MLLEMSMSSVQRRFVSSSYCLTYSRSWRAQTFQSTCRRSSPVTYSRCCRNSTDCPKYGLRCIPERKPSTMCRARTSSREMRLIASGCKNLFEPGIAGELVFLGGCAGDQAIDDLVGADAVALGGEVDHEAVPQHGLGQRLNIVGADVRSPAKKCSRFTAENQKLHSPRARAPADLIVNKIGHARLAHARLADQRQSVANNVIADGHLAHRSLQLDDLLTTEHRLNII